MWHSSKLSSNEPIMINPQYSHHNESVNAPFLQLNIIVTIQHKLPRNRAALHRSVKKKKKGPVCADNGRLIFHSGPQVLKLIFINLVWTWNRSFQVFFFFFSVQYKRTESVIRRHNTTFIIIWFHLHFCAQLSGPSNWLGALWQPQSYYSPFNWIN